MKPSIQFAKRTDGVKIAYSEFGNGQPLVIAPPWTTSLRFIIEDPNMNHFIKQLSKNLTVIFYDKHGCGQSDRDRKEFTIETELFDLETVVNHLGLDNFNLLGSSMSGPTSIAYTARYPDRVNKLVLYGSYAKGEKLAKKEVQDAIISLIEASWGLGSKTLADIFTPGADSEELQSQAKYQRLSSDSATAIKILKLCYSVDVTAALSTIKTPALIIHREGDRTIPIGHGRELSSEIVNSTFKILDGVSHPMWSKGSDGIINEILEFLCDGVSFRTAIMPNTQKVKRKLSAILSADVKGYSLLMANDEMHTIQTLKTYRNLMSDLIQHHAGRVVDNPGDNLLAEFSSAVDSVEAAVAIQKKLKKENAKFVEDKRLQFRIGVNIGDVVRDDDRIYGSGVNIAARIEGIADPGGICISRNTYNQVKDKVDLGFEYLGEHEVKNIEEPARVYKVLLDTDAPKPLVEEHLELPNKPSIAVLPFTNMSGDPSQEYFSDGLTEHIINGLCKVTNLFVIARNSSFAYKDKSISVKRIAKELGVRYILEGSVQRAGERVRITAQLIDATTDYHMWSENYDRNLEDIFSLQDEIAGKLINAMAFTLISGEQARLWEGGTTNIQALDKINRGMESFNRFNQHDNAQARLFFKEASILDELSALIYGLIGLTHFFDLLYNWSDSPAESFVEAEKNANKALALNASLDLPHMLLGFAHLIKKEYDKAIVEAKQAVSLNPNGAYAFSALGYITSLAGDPKKGITLTKKAIRLNPIPPSRDYHILGLSYRLAGRYEKAIEVLIHSLKIDPAALTPYITLASCYMELNQFENAQKAAKKVLEIDPHFSLEYHQVTLPVKDQILLNKHIDALRKAGLPD